MANGNKIGGLAIFCDLTGKIVNVLKDDIGLEKLNPVGRLFSTLISPDQRNSSLDFIFEIKAQNVAFDYRFNLNIKDQFFDMYFMGVQLNTNILVIGADNHKEAIEFTNHLQQINNEQSNLIRELYKDKFRTKQMQDDSEHLFDEITKLNNQLINLQRELTRKNVELKRLNELKNQFLGMAVHDMRNPLNVIASYAEFILDEAGDKLTSEHHEFLTKIQTTAGFMFNLIEDLLDVSKIESGKLQLNMQKHDFIEFAFENIVRNNLLAHKKNIIIKIQSELEELEMYFDRQKLEQVFNNLLNNAVKFSFPKSIIEVCINVKDDKLQLKFKDAGKGIAKENYDKVFQPFQKIANKGTDGEKGTGLGLTIVKKIIEGHQGEIWFESEVKNLPASKNGGTTFFISLPINSKRA